MKMGVWSVRTFVAIAALVCTSGVMGQTVPTEVLNGLGISNGRMQVPVFDFDDDGGTLITEIEIDDTTAFTVVLDRRSNRADGFKVLVGDGSGVLTQVPPPPVSTYQGFVVQEPTSRVRASFVDGVLQALIFVDEKVWAVQPASDGGQSFQNSGQYVVYESRDILPTAGECGVVSDHSTSSSSSGVTPGGSTGIKVCEIACDSDFQFFLDHGSVNAVVNDIENTINGVEAAYEVSGVQIHYDVTTIIVRTAAGEYGIAGAGALLDEFFDVWGSSPENQIDGDVAHLFTGENLTGTTIGIADISRICQSNIGRGLSQSTSSSLTNRVALTAHELGHNWSAQHCNSSPTCRIMCSGLGGCDGLSPMTFAPAPASSIWNYRASRTCLHDLPETASLPFFDDFASSSLNLDNWSYNDGVIVSSSASGEPSLPFALQLNSVSSALYTDDDIRTTFINTAGSSQPYLQYYTKPEGVPAGGVLYIDYWRTGQQWININTITSDGSTASGFSVHTHLLPSNARHSEFRVRFRVDVAGSSQRWYVDDVSVTEGMPVPDGPPEVVSVSPSSGAVTGGTVVSIFGTDFAPDATVSFDFTPLTNMTFVSPTELQGVTPAAGSSGPVLVVVTQSSGSDALLDGFLYATNNLSFGTSEGAPGGQATIMALITNEEPLSGFSMAGVFDWSLLDIVNVGVDGTVAAGADFVAPNMSNLPTQSWYTLGVVMDLAPPLTEVLPAGDNQPVAALEFTISGSAIPGTFSQITPTNGTGSPPVENIFALVGGFSIDPETFPGLIQFVDSAGFVRGDGNADGTVDIADPVANLAFLFSLGPVLCMDAFDTNDDGAVDIADPVYNLAFLFSSGPPPTAPYPIPGSDPTADSLGCDL